MSSQRTVSIPPEHHVSLVMFCGAVVGLCGCLGDDFPSLVTTPPHSCGNGVCEVGLEDCINCPQDCPCCAVVDSAGSEAVVNPEAIIGSPDGNHAELNEYSSIVLVIGREIVNDLFAQDSSEQISTSTVGRPDFALVGEVLSESTAETINCASASTGEGSFEVSASLDGANYRFVGFWTRQTSEFDIGCAQLKSARFIQIRGQPSARGLLDAVTSDSCLVQP